MVLLPQDKSGESIQILGLLPGGNHELTSTGSSQLIGPFTTGINVISIYADNAIRVEVGDANTVATATSHFIPAATYLLVSLNTGTSSHTDGLPTGLYLAVLQDTMGGAVHVSERT